MPEPKYVQEIKLTLATVNERTANIYHVMERMEQHQALQNATLARHDEAITTYHEAIYQRSGGILSRLTHLENRQWRMWIILAAAIGSGVGIEKLVGG